MNASKPETSGPRDPRRSSTAKRGKNPACQPRRSRTSWICPWSSAPGRLDQAIVRAGIFRRRPCGAQLLRFFRPVSWLVFYRAALGLSFRIGDATAGKQISQRRFHVFAAGILVAKDLIVHRPFVGKLAVAIDDEKAGCRLGPVAARDAAVGVEEECRNHGSSLRYALPRSNGAQVTGFIGRGCVDRKPHDIVCGSVALQGLHRAVLVFHGRERTYRVGPFQDDNLAGVVTQAMKFSISTFGAEGRRRCTDIHAPKTFGTCASTCACS